MVNGTGQIQFKIGSGGKSVSVSVKFIVRLLHRYMFAWTLLVPVLWGPANMHILCRLWPLSGLAYTGLISLFASFFTLVMTSELQINCNDMHRNAEKLNRNIKRSLLSIICAVFVGPKVCLFFLTNFNYNSWNFGRKERWWSRRDELEKVWVGEFCSDIIKASLWSCCYDGVDCRHSWCES